MKTLVLTTAIAGCVAWSSPAMAEKYQLLPVITHMGIGRLNYTALLLDTGAGSAFNCSAQFDAKLSKFTGESACLAVSVEGKLPLGNVALPAALQNPWLDTAMNRGSAIRRSYLLHRAFDHLGR